MTRVVLLHYPSQSVSPGPRFRTSLARKEAFWLDPYRNVRIAGVAEMVVNRRVKKLRALGIELPRLDALDVAVLVESTAQARHLRVLLSDWRIEHESQVGPTPDQPKAKRSARTRRIITLVSAYRHRSTPNVLIRATGDSGRCCSGEPPELVIDFFIPFDRRSSSDESRRISEYQQWGWQITCSTVAAPAR